MYKDLVPWFPTKIFCLSKKRGFSSNKCFPELATLVDDSSFALATV